MSTESSARFAGKPWWQMPLMSTARRVHGDHPPMKGEYGGQCQRIACENREAHWFNDTNGRYYCASCANTFNEVCRRNGQPPLCILHPASVSGPLAASAANQERIPFE